MNRKTLLSVSNNQAPIWRQVVNDNRGRKDPGSPTAGGRPCEVIQCEFSLLCGFDMFSTVSVPAFFSPSCRPAPFAFPGTDIKSFEIFPQLLYSDPTQPNNHQPPTRRIMLRQAVRMTTPKLSPSAVAQGRIRAMNNWLGARVNVNHGDTLEEHGHGRREKCPTLLEEGGEAHEHKS